MNAQPSGRLVFGGEEAGLGELASARFVVLPAAMEMTVSYGAGTARGPEAILRASEELEFFDEETGSPYWSPGDVHTLSPLVLPTGPEGAVAAIAAAARPVVEAGRFLLTLGGEHTVTLGALRAVAASHPEVGVLVLDAHLDLRDSYQGTSYSHACVFRRVHEDLGLPIVWCGTRSLSAEEAELVERESFPVFYAHQLDAREDWMDRVISALPERVYVSIDVDALDPSAIPGTGTPEPGGLTYRQTIALLREVASQCRIVAADVVELAPIPHEQVSEFTAARLIAKLIGAVGARARRSGG